MQVLIEDQEEGLKKLIGKTVILLCANYFYTGKLVGVNSTAVKLQGMSIIYETGEWSAKKWENVQKVTDDYFYVSTGAIESFGESKKA
jgi:hypothetical protein